MTGILGGSFDPPHNGHIALARAALEQLPIDRLIVLVAANPGHRQVVAGADDRLALAKAAFAELREGASLRNEDAAEDETELCASRARVLLRGVTGGDVPDLVTEDARELRLIVEKRQDAARDVDVTARQCERVDGRHVEDGEMPRQVRPLAHLRELQTESRDVLL